MAINYPTSIDTFTNPEATDTLDSPSHSTQHSNVNDAVEALEAKVGANSSTVTTSHDYKLGEVTSTDKAVGKAAIQTLTNKTIDGDDNTLQDIATASLKTKTGSDGNVVTGTAGSSGQPAVWNADGDVVGGTVAIADGGTGQTTQTAGMDALSPTTTKGDLLVDNGTNVVRLAIGINDQVLTADSTQTEGVKWAAAGGAILPTQQIFTSNATTLGDSTSRYDITNPTGTTYRYTYDSTGTDPGITALTMPIGSFVTIYNSSSISESNTGCFQVTGSGANYFEVTNAGGGVESDKTTGGGLRVSTVQTWTKPASLSYIMLEVVGGGGSGGGASGSDDGSSGGAGGGYGKIFIDADDLAATESLIVGDGGIGTTYDDGIVGGTSIFYISGGTNVVCTGGGRGRNGSDVPDAGGTCTGADVIIPGGRGQRGAYISGSTYMFGGAGGSTPLGFGGIGSQQADGNGYAGTGYGSGGGGATDDGGTATNGGSGATGAVIVTEFY